MYLRQWHAEGVTPGQLGDAVLLARERKPHPELIPARYIATIVPDVVRGLAKLPNAPRGEDAVAIAISNLAREEAANAAH